MHGNRHSPTERFVRAVWPVGLLVVLMVAAGAITWLVRPATGFTEPAAPPETATLEAVQRGFNWMADRVKPAVVFIEVEQKPRSEELAEAPMPEIPDPLRDFFGRDWPFPGRPPTQPRGPSMGQGSGVVIDPAGFILTNNHVVGRAAKVTVHLPAGESYPAEVVGADPLTDLAVIRIQPKKALPAATLGDAENLQVGSWAMAIGFPFGGQRYGGRFDEALRYEPTVTVGVISATERQLESDIPGRPYRNLLQTDAPINPGSSGGPLVNIRAEVIGINQAIFTSGPFAGNIGVGFAIPINEHTKRIIETLKGGEPVIRGQLGVLVSPLTPTLKAVYGAESGVFVEEAQPDSPAARSGLKAEDVITRYDGKDVRTVEQFVTMVQNTPPGTTVEVEVLREGKKTRLKVTIEELALETAARRQVQAEGGPLGIGVETLPAERAQEIGIPGGVLVRTVNPLGEAARAGLRAGDIIVRINRREITDAASFERTVAELKAGDPVAIRVWREGRMLTAQIERLGE